MYLTGAIAFMLTPISDTKTLFYSGTCTTVNLIPHDVQV